MTQKQKIKEFIEAIHFIADYGKNEDGFIQKKFRQFLDSNGEANDNSIQLAHEHRRNLQIVENAEEFLTNLLDNQIDTELKFLYEEYAKEDEGKLHESAKPIKKNLLKLIDKLKLLDNWISTNYDELADVLYINIKKSNDTIAHPISDSELVILDKKTNQVIGLTLIGYKERYFPQPPKE